MKNIQPYFKDIQLATLLFGFSVLVGFIYSFSQFNYRLSFNIFDYMNTTDILFSWITDINLLSLIIILLSSFILKNYPNKIVLFISIFINITYLLCLLSNSWSDNTKLLIIGLLIVIPLLLIYIFILYYKFTLTEENKNFDKIVLFFKRWSIFNPYECINNISISFNKFDNLNEIKKKYRILLDEISSIQNSDPTIIKLKNIEDIKRFNIPKYLLEERKKSFAIYLTINELINKEIQNRLTVLKKIYKSEEYIVKKIESLLELSFYNQNIINSLKKDDNFTSDIFIPLIIFLFVSLVFGIIAARTLEDENNHSNIVDIKLVRNIEPNNIQCYYKLYKITSNYTIVKPIGNEKNFIVFNNNDISFMEFKTNSEKDNNCSNINDTNKIKEDMVVITNLINSNNFEFKGIIFKKNLYFDDLIFNKDINSFNDLNTLKDLVNQKSKYIINITGKSSKKKINLNNNTIKDNYSLSIARAENTKKAILNLFIENKINIRDIEFNLSGESNQTTDNKTKGSVEIEVIEFRLK